MVVAMAIESIVHRNISLLLVSTSLVSNSETLVSTLATPSCEAR